MFVRVCVGSDCRGGVEAHVVEEGWKHTLLVTHIRRRSSGDVIICHCGS